MRVRRLNPNQACNQNAYEIASADSTPANILEKIVWHKEREVAQMYAQLPIAQIKAKLIAHQNELPTRDFVAALRQSPTKPALIAEAKKASPSRGLLRPNFDPAAIAQGYAAGGASCMSVLTDAEFFQGSFNNLRLIRNAVDLPLLCKEFIIDPYQIYLARLNGADAVLLIAAILSDRDLADFQTLIRSLGMIALIEVHNSAELQRVLKLPDLALVGINNRDLQTFTVDIKQTELLLAEVESAVKSQILWVSESGIYTNADLKYVRDCGAGAVLVGESLIKQSDLEQAVKDLINK
ncbi:indole-3-glycerol phosphate synthase [Thalassoporum mexicanum PCC 7367]|uniref:indole-3-glycerol phosphate synthase TrpC n=1 Tax=Thalassoporum mexicanum TaxID=3457544 RepID=UPI00029FCDB5|nr:indole-3-glycerol phosphate synthase TrpC [Pseudanabaena sp. PCC 7367]AFY71781.1 indole-3-glycerol phosphate synthase [Pseudanabaena sp. PCC 7367]